jgi:hypothetical protein
MTKRKPQNLSPCLRLALSAVVAIVVEDLEFGLRRAAVFTGAFLADFLRTFLLTFFLTFFLTFLLSLAVLAVPRFDIDGATLLVVVLLRVLDFLLVIWPATKAYTVVT